MAMIFGSRLLPAFVASPRTAPSFPYAWIDYRKPPGGRQGEGPRALRAPASGEPEKDASRADSRPTDEDEARRQQEPAPLEAAFVSSRG
jgi:hypothetical protein